MIAELDPWKWYSLPSHRPHPTTTPDCQALYAAQQGETDPAAKPLKGFSGTSVMEIVDRHGSDTYRAVYTTTLAGALYVLHAFQKKSKRGIDTPQRDLDLTGRRLAVAIEHYKERQH